MILQVAKLVERNLLPLAFVAAGVAGAVYLVGRKAAGAVDAAADRVTEPLAEIYITATRLPNPVQGMVVLPTQERVSLDAIVKAGSFVDSNMRFTWKGTRYQITQRLTDNLYGSTKA